MDGCGLALLRYMRPLRLSVPNRFAVNEEDLRGSNAKERALKVHPAAAADLAFKTGG